MSHSGGMGMGMWKEWCVCGVIGLVARGVLDDGVAWCGKSFVEWSVFVSLMICFFALDTRCHVTP